MRQNRRFTVVGGVVLLTAAIGLADGAAAGEAIPPPRPVVRNPARDEEPRWAPAPSDSPLRKVTLPIRTPQVVREERQFPTVAVPASWRGPGSDPVTPARLAAEAVRTGSPAVRPAAPAPVVRPEPAAPGDSVVIVGGVAVPLPPDPPVHRGP